eukprot:3792236-Prymnesium_polylepis.1
MLDSKSTVGEHARTKGPAAFSVSPRLLCCKRSTAFSSSRSPCSLALRMRACTIVVCAESAASVI